MFSEAPGNVDRHIKRGLWYVAFGLCVCADAHGQEAEQ